LRRLRKAVVIRPQGIAAMVLRTGKVQGIRRLQAKAGAQFRRLKLPVGWTDQFSMATMTPGRH
jgi:hypothetical protein